MSDNLVAVTGRFSPATLARLDRLAELLPRTNKAGILAGVLHIEVPPDNEASKP